MLSAKSSATEIGIIGATVAAGRSRSGGTLYKPDKYLGLHEGELGFRIVADESQREAKWNQWSKILHAKCSMTGIRIKSSRFKPGMRMKVAILNDDYRQMQPDGRLDLNRTIVTIQMAKALMDAAVEEPISAQQIDGIFHTSTASETVGIFGWLLEDARSQFSWFNFEEVVLEFQQALYENGWVTPAFDWIWQESARRVRGLSGEGRAY